MKLSLVVIILILCAALYYTYTLLDENETLYGPKINTLEHKVVKLQAENQKLQDENAQMQANLITSRTKIIDLTEQNAATERAVNVTKQAINSAREMIMPAMAPALAVVPASPSTTISLGTIATLDGKIYQNCQLIMVEPDGITVTHILGTVKIPFKSLPLEIQKKFGYAAH